MCPCHNKMLTSSKLCWCHPYCVGTTFVCVCNVGEPVVFFEGRIIDFFLPWNVLSGISFCVHFGAATCVFINPSNDTFILLLTTRNQTTTADPTGSFHWQTLQPLPEGQSQAPLADQNEAFVPATQHFVLFCIACWSVPPSRSWHRCECTTHEQGVCLFVFLFCLDTTQIGII